MIGALKMQENTTLLPTINMKVEAICGEFVDLDKVS